MDISIKTFLLKKSHMILVKIQKKIKKKNRVFDKAFLIFLINFYFYSIIVLFLN